MAAVSFAKSAASPLLYLVIFALSCAAPGEKVSGLAAEAGAGASARYVLPEESAERRPDDAVARGRMLSPFQVCRECRCCDGGSPDKCWTMPCCYGLVCGIPGKPSGTCAFVVKSCNCSGCS